MQKRYLHQCGLIADPNSSDVRVSRSMLVFVYRGRIYTLLQRIGIKLSTEVS